MADQNREVPDLLAALQTSVDRARADRAARCNCATYGNAGMCPHHTQADYDSAERARLPDRGAPQSVVEAVQEALGCVRDERPDYPNLPVVCLTHGCSSWSERGCWDAVDAADAAFAATLEWAAEHLPSVTEGVDREGTAFWRERDQDVYSLAVEEAQDALRRLAGDGAK